jgi:1,4-dihydroxy-2-naphthoate octaprenyltransferase
MQQFITTLRLSRPLYLLLAALTYFLGAGVARYLGHPLILQTFWLGLIGLVLAQASMNLLVEVFRSSNEPIIKGETLANRKAIQDAALYISIAVLAVVAVIAFLLIRAGQLVPSVWFYFAISLFVIFIYSIPPFRLVDKGYGEALLAVHLGFLVPSIAFLLQSGGYHRLLSATLIPVTLLALSSMLALDFPSYSEDLKYARQTLLVRLGWERVVPLHHFLVITAYVLFALEPLFGFSLKLFWPAFLTLPFALIQIFWLRNIALGAKPIWLLLTYNAMSIIGMTIYFLVLAFWLH